jgi:opacity protein-like surface antigen
MRKRLINWIIFFIMVGFFVQTSQAIQVGTGLHYGLRQVQDELIKETYGNGYVYVPYLRLIPFRSIGFEVAYEGGYKKNGTVGIYEEDSTLSVTGLEFSGIFFFPLRTFVAYVKLGMGYYSYKQDIESDFTRMTVDHSKWSSLIGGGVIFRVLDRMYISAEVKSVSLRVMPYDTEVNLSGLRFLIGIGYSFEF